MHRFFSGYRPELVVCVCHSGAAARACQWPCPIVTHPVAGEPQHKDPPPVPHLPRCVQYHLQRANASKCQRSARDVTPPAAAPPPRPLVPIPLLHPDYLHGRHDRYSKRMRHWRVLTSDHVNGTELPLMSTRLQIGGQSHDVAVRAVRLPSLQLGV